jgi:hypothetical protein
MNVIQELRTFSDDAYELALKMSARADGITGEPAQDLKAEAVAMDRMARDMAAITDTIKDLAYRLGRGEIRVSTVQVSR